jgi:hypothetical protein
MAELDLFRTFRGAVAPMSAEAERRASARLKAAIEETPVSGGPARADHERHRRIVVFAAAALVVVVAAASAVAAARELFFDPSKPRQESRTVDSVEFTFTVPAWWENGPIVKVGESSSGVPDFRAGNVFVSKSFGVIGQHASAVIYWTAFPEGGEAAPCSNLLTQGVGGSTYALAAAMARAPGVSVVQRPLRTTVGGSPATQVVLKVLKDRGCEPGYFFTWRPRSVAQCWGACWIGTGVGGTIRVWIVDVAGKRLVLAALTARIPPDLPTQARAEWPKAEREIAGIIRSIRFR